MRKLVSALLLALSCLAFAQIPPGPSGLSKGQANQLYSTANPLAQLPHWQAALARVTTGTGTAKIAFVGDSTTQGRGSTGTDYTNTEAFSAPSYFAQLLSAAGIPANADTGVFVGGSVVVPTVDPRWVFGSGWNLSGATLGGTLIDNTTTTNALSFTPTGTFDTIETTYVSKASIPGSITVNVDGGSTLQTINTSGVEQVLVKTSVTCTRGKHTINYTPTGTGTHHFIATVRCYDSTQPGISVYNFGFNGGEASNFNVLTGNFSPLTALEFYAPDLTLINLTINDSVYNTGVAAHYSNLLGIAQAAQTVGDVVMVVGTPYGSPPANYSSYVQNVYAVAAAVNCPVIDLSARWGNEASMNAIMPYYDGTHPTKAGYSDIAKAYAQRLIPSVNATATTYPTPQLSQAIQSIVLTGGATNTTTIQKGLGSLIIVSGTAASSQTINLPTSPVVGDRYDVSVRNLNAILSGNGINIEGSSSLVNGGNYTIAVIYDGTQWRIVSNTTASTTNNLSANHYQLETYLNAVTFSSYLNIAGQSFAASGTISASNGTYVAYTATAVATPILTLPSSPGIGQIYIIVDEGGNAATNVITIAGNGKTINGGTTITTNYGVRRLRYNGTAWFNW